MGDVDPRLVAAATREIRSVESECRTPLTAEEAVPVVLGLFTIRDEWQSMAHDDVNGVYPDEHSQTYSTVEAAILGVGDTSAFAGSYPRVMLHRFVAETEWQQVKARIDWEPT